MVLFDGLPLHPLLVHAPVVLLPLVAVGLVVWVLWPAGRRTLAPVLALLAVAAAVTSILSAFTGEQLAEALQYEDAVDAHQEWGERTRLAAVVVALATCLLAAVQWFQPNGRLASSRIPATAVLVLAVGATGVAGLTGHSGATLAWEERIAAALEDGDAPPTPTPTESSASPTSEDDEPVESESEPTDPDPAPDATEPGDDDTDAPDDVDPDGPEPVDIEIDSFDFDPQQVTVPVGTEVTWTNEDPVNHTTTAVDDEFDSGSLGSDESFTVTFDTPGSFAYFCAIHPAMQAAVTVTG